MELDPGKSEVFNRAVNDAMATHLLGSAASGVDIGGLDDQEFLAVVQSVKGQPMNPFTIVGTNVEFSDPQNWDTPLMDDVVDVLRGAAEELRHNYREHGVEPTRAIDAATQIISHTEAYITGYSRELGILGHRMVAANVGHNALQRWVAKLWVPEEDMHDRSLSFQNTLVGEVDMEEFFAGHAHHMQVGMHVPLVNLEQSTAYLAQQEGSTVPSYQGYAALLGPTLGQIPRAVGAQEARHTRFYTYVDERMMDEFPDDTVVALLGEEEAFEMPGMEGIPNFASMAAVAGLVGILDPVKVLTVQQRLNTRLKIADRQFTTDEAKRAQDILVNPSGPFSKAKLEKRQRQMEILRERAVEKERREGEPLPAILGMTVVADPRTNELSFPYSS